MPSHSTSHTQQALAEALEAARRAYKLTSDADHNEVPPRIGMEVTVKVAAAVSALEQALDAVE